MKKILLVPCLMVISNVLMSMTDSIDLVPRFERDPIDLTVNEGNAAYYEMVVMGSPMVHGNIFHNGKQLDYLTKTVIYGDQAIYKYVTNSESNYYSFIVRNTTKTDEGYYNFRFSNRVGVTNSTAILYVIPKI